MASKRKKRQKSNRPAVIELLSYKERKNKTIYKKIIRKDPCSYCGAPITKEEANTADHIEPRSILTEECSWDNFTSACRLCNNKKGNKPVFIFINELREQGKFLNYESNIY